MLIDELEKFKRENTEGLIDQYGTCRFCGQSKMFQTIQPWRQDALDEAAAESCGCWKSKEYAAVKRKKEKAEDAIEKKFSEEAEAESVLTVDQRNFLKKVAYEIAEERMEKATVQFFANRCQIKVAFSVGSKGGIKIERTITKKAVEEV